MPDSVNHFNAAQFAMHATQSGVTGRDIILAIVMCVTNALRTNLHQKMDPLALRNAVVLVIIAAKMRVCTAAPSITSIFVKYALFACPGKTGDRDGEIALDEL